MSDNGAYPKEIFTATLIDEKTIKINFKTNFMPVLLTAAKLLDLQLENMIIEQNINAEASKITPVDLSKLGKMRIGGFKI